MKSRWPYFLVVFTALLAPAAHAQFGSGIVYDPTQSAHAIQQLSQGEQELQKWAQELQKWEQHLQKEEQIYTTAYQTMNQVIAAYNLAYQMSRMPQNLAARYKSDFSQWTRLSNSSSSGSNTSGITSAWLECARPRQSHPRRIRLQWRGHSGAELSIEQALGSGLDDPGHGAEPVRQLPRSASPTSPICSLRSAPSVRTRRPSSRSSPTLNRTPIRPIRVSRPRSAYSAKINTATHASDPLAAGHQPDPRCRCCPAGARRQGKARRAQPAHQPGHLLPAELSPPPCRTSPVA